MPITWRNVNSTVSNSGTASLMDGAQRSFTGGFDALQKVLDAQKTTNDDNWEQGSENNTNALMNKLAGVQDPAELAAMRERGEFQKMMQGYGAQVDQSAVRTALDGRGEYLRNEMAGQQGHEDTQFNRGLRPEIQELMAVARGGGPGSEQAIAQMGQLGYRDDGQMLTNLADAADKGLGRDHAKNADSRSAQRTAMAWNADARAQQDQSHRNYLNARTVATNELSDAADGVLREHFSGAQTAYDSGMSATAYNQAGIAALVDAGVDPKEATAMIEGNDAALASSDNPSLLDTAAYNREKANLAKEFNVDPEVGQPTAEEAAATSRTVLSNFRDEEGRLFGTTDPEEALEISRETAALLRDGVTVDGIHYMPSEAEVAGALEGVGEGIFDYRPEGAMKDYIKNSPGMTAKAKNRQKYNAALSILDSGQEAAVGTDYENDATRQANADRIARALAEAEASGDYTLEELEEMEKAARANLAGQI